MKGIKCSQCGLVNFADAFACKRCNYQFQSNAQNANQTYAYNPASAPTNSYNYSNSYQNGMYSSSYQNQNQSYSNPYQSQMASSSDSRGGGARMFFGALTAIGGLIATAVSYSSASEGGTYYVFWGLILVGAINFLLGLNAHFSDNS